MVEVPVTQYARTSGGGSVAYQVVVRVRSTCWCCMGIQFPWICCGRTLAVFGCGTGWGR